MRTTPQSRAAYGPAGGRWTRCRGWTVCFRRFRLCYLSGDLTGAVLSSASGRFNNEHQRHDSDVHQSCASTQIICHLRHYNGPVYQVRVRQAVWWQLERTLAPVSVFCVLQRYIVRIIFLVPVYSVASWLSLLVSDKSVYFDTVRDW